MFAFKYGQDPNSSWASSTFRFWKIRCRFLSRLHFCVKTFIWAKHFKEAYYSQSSDIFDLLFPHGKVRARRIWHEWYQQRLALNWMPSCSISVETGVCCEYSPVFLRSCSCHHSHLLLILLAAFVAGSGRGTFLEWLAHHKQLWDCFFGLSLTCITSIFCTDSFSFPHIFFLASFLQLLFDGSLTQTEKLGKFIFWEVRLASSEETESFIDVYHFFDESCSMAKGLQTRAPSRDESKDCSPVTLCFLPGAHKVMHLDRSLPVWRIGRSLAFAPLLLGVIKCYTLAILTPAGFCNLNWALSPWSCRLSSRKSIWGGLCHFLAADIARSWWHFAQEKIYLYYPPEYPACERSSFRHDISHR